MLYKADQRMERSSAGQLDGYNARDASATEDLRHSDVMQLGYYDNNVHHHQHHHHHYNAGARQRHIKVYRSMCYQSGVSHNFWVFFGGGRVIWV